MSLQGTSFSNYKDSYVFACIKAKFVQRKNKEYNYEQNIIWKI